jgi:1,2-dihydroxy-3-keto-5-methylthiopentene dioxygenase
MSILSVYQDSVPEQPLKVLTHIDDIAATLAEVGVHLERWEASAPIGAGASSEEVIAAYRPQIDRLMSERGYVTVDVISLTSDHPQKAELRAKFLEEHRHAVLCEKNDLISVPAGTRHWFDMGEHPHFVAIRLFNNPEGWVAQFTGEDIAGRFPRLED